MTSAFDDLRVAVIDVEGNGQQPPEIVEIAIIPMDDLAIVGEPTIWLVKPERPITGIVTRKVHGIHNSDVADAPPFTEIAFAVLALLDGRIPVAHNARVEYDVLRRHLPEWAPALMLDTMRLAKAIWPGLASYSLDPLLTHAGIVTDDTYGSRHRAGFDAHATARLFAVLAEAAGDRDALVSAGCIPSLLPQPQPDQGGLW